jgi:hypothetical protein
MDHSEAVRLQAAEKYVLGELQGALRDEYEEHCFDCVECALDLKSVAAFVDTSRQMFREEAASAQLAVAGAGRPAQVRTSWLQQFRWAFAAVPAFAALVLVAVVSYQNTVTIPGLKSASARPSLSSETQVLDLGASGARRGAESTGTEPPIQIRANEPFAVAFDFTPDSANLPAYVAQLRDASGRVLLQMAVPADKVNQHFAFAVPGGLLPAPGSYHVLLFGADTASGQPLAGRRVQTFAITVAFRQ